MEYAEAVVGAGALKVLERDTRALGESGAMGFVQERLFAACQLGDLQAARAALCEGGDVNARDTEGSTPLSRAVASEAEGALAVAEMLLLGGANPDAVVCNLTPLMWAAGTRQARALDMVRMLLDYGANPNKMTAAGTPLLKAIRRRCRADRVPSRWERETLDIMRALLAAGADVEAGHALGGTPMLAAASNASVEVAQLLFEAGASLSRATRSPLSPLVAAAARGCPEMVDWLRDVGAPVDCRDEILAAAVRRAVLLFRLDAVRLLIAVGAPVNECDSGETPLMLVASRSRGRLRFALGATELLLGAGADARGALRCAQCEPVKALLRASLARQERAELDQALSAFPETMAEPEVDPAVVVADARCVPEPAPRGRAVRRL